MNAPQLVKVRTVYGDIFYVSQADLDGPRTLLPIYCATGMKRSEHAHRMNWSPLCHSLHRGNIESVKP